MMFIDHLMPSSAKATFIHLQHKDARTYEKPSKHGHVGIRWLALAEYSTCAHTSGFQSFSKCVGQISHQQHKG